MSSILCLDIGGTAIKNGLYEQSGKLIKKYPITPTQQTQGTIVKTIIQMIESRLEETEINGIAISSAGVIDSCLGEVIYAGYTIPDYTGVKLKALLEAHFSLPCEVENDVNAACLGEVWRGSGQGYQSVVCLTIGTGIGGAIMLEGKLISGASFMAGEFGYIPIKGKNFQDLASATSLIKRANELATVEHYPDGKAIFQAAKNGEPSCREAIDEFVDHLCEGLVTIMYILNPELIILGGGIMAQRHYLEPKIRTAISEKLISPVFQQTKISFAKLKNEAGMLGALYHYNKKQ